MSSPAEKAPEASRERILSPDAQQQREDMILNGVIADPEATTPDKVEVAEETPSPWEMLGDMLAKLDPETREAAVEHFSDLGSPAVAGEAGILEPTPDADTADVDAPLAPVIPLIPKVEKKHTTFIDEADIEDSSLVETTPTEATVTVPVVEAEPAAVVEIRPGATTEAPIVQPLETLEHRVATAKKLLETAPAGKVHRSERRYVNKVSRDARTDERDRIKNNDQSMAENKNVTTTSEAHDQAFRELRKAEFNNTRAARRARLQREINEKSAAIEASLKVGDAPVDQRALKARIKTMKKATKKSILKETKDLVTIAETKLSTKQTEYNKAQKARETAVKGRRWYKNTRVSAANRAGRGVKSHASRPSPVRAMGAIETDEDKKRRREAEAARTAA